MSRPRLGILLAASLLSIAFLQSAWGQANPAAPTPAASDPNAAELQATIDKYIAAYSEGAIDNVMGHWAEDADFVDVHGRFHEGRDLIAALFRRGFANNPGRKLELKSVARKFLTPDVAMDDGLLELTDASGEKDSGRYTVIWTKVKGKWLIRSARDVPLEAEAAPTAEQAPPLEELAFLVGKWEAKSDKHQITLECNWQLDKSFLVQTFHVKSADDDFRVLTYITFDPAEGRFRSWFFDSRGGFGGGPWTKRDKTYKAAIVSVLPDGQIGSSLITWEATDANSLQWHAIEREVGGDALPDARQTYTRTN